MLDSYGIFVAGPAPYMGTRGRDDKNYRHLVNPVNFAANLSAASSTLHCKVQMLASSMFVLGVVACSLSASFLPGKAGRVIIDTEGILAGNPHPHQHPISLQRWTVVSTDPSPSSHHLRASNGQEAVWERKATGVHLASKRALSSTPLQTFFPYQES